MTSIVEKNTKGPTDAGDEAGAGDAPDAGDAADAGNAVDAHVATGSAVAPQDPSPSKASDGSRDAEVAEAGQGVGEASNATQSGRGALPGEGALPGQAGLPSIDAFPVRTRPRLTIALMLLSDLLVHALVIVAALLGRSLIVGAFDWRPYLDLWLVIPAIPVIYWALRLYAIPLSPVEEMRRLFFATTGIYLLLGTISFLTQSSLDYSRAIYAAAWLGAVVLTPGCRGLLRLIMARKPWWGVPTLVVGRGKIGRRLIRMMVAQPEMGLRPRGYLDAHAFRAHSYNGVPRVGHPDELTTLLERDPRYRVVVVASEAPADWLERLMHEDRLAFRHLIVVAGPSSMASLGVEAHDLMGFLGLQVRPRLLDPMHMFWKRLIECTLILLAAPLWLPLLAALCVLVRLTSPGQAIFRQERIGRGGQRFDVFKLRTMYADAEHRLEEYLDSDPQAKLEFQRTGKLRKDPRVTAVGDFLRRSSMDELPQLFNVLRGSMCLVGPRPIVDREIANYGDAFSLYCRVRPGVTGLWQVSGRNRLSYVERVRLDAHYVRNWSVWMDLFILMKTVAEVVLQRGAH